MNRFRTLSQVAAVLLCAAGVMVAAQGGSSVMDTRHNLSASGPGPITVAGTQEVCGFCHTPHAAAPAGPLWNRNDPGTYYQTYTSTTLEAAVGQPTGSSRLCLSCHDGTVALTQTHNAQNAPPGTIFISAGDAGYIGTELTDDHPISFDYDSSLVMQNPELRDPAALPPELPLDANGQLQCTTCHDPHHDKHGKFLRMSTMESQLCTTCHLVDGWTSSPHALSGSLLAGAAGGIWDDTPFNTVREAACEGCHRPHTAGGRERLLRREAEEDNCYSCHDGSVAGLNVYSEFQKFSRHPVERYTGMHDPTENPLSMAEHVECVDCHDPHRSYSSGAAIPPNIGGSMQGASGLSSTGVPLKEAQFAYEVCYKCHAWHDSFALPTVDRVLRNSNVADEFSPNNASYHPVEAQGKNMNVPSLVQPLTTSTLVRCTDCHGTDAGSGPRGPHGSAYRPLLVRNYNTTDGATESPVAYALCYECHNRSSILADESFEEHKKHIDDENTPCSVCHDAHGVSATQSSPQNSTHLINFDRDIVGPSEKAQSGPIFEDRGFERGSCTLKCHGEDHDDEDYDGSHH